ncbi:hypothetical protein [Nocardioides renjunii]|uniref:hypothetical protein n=1 Tax=Nocardioides renjunii TaxID=3095075 RepID=UPI002B0034C0|nr:hypothetical protein [Nocardioides sp. S-34]WQQ21979.1 hypothetical protein SHK17_19075 [Nocardioides sp. S-34]
MRNLLAGAFVSLLASMLTVTASPVAHADAVATLDVATPVAVPGECYDYRVNYDMNLPPGATSWFAELKAKSGGNGGQTTTDIAYYEALSGSGFTSVDLCVFSKKDLKVGLALTGSYEDGAGGGTISADLSIKLKPAKTRTKLSVSTVAPRFNQVVRFNGRVQYYHGDFTAWYAQESVWAQLQIRAGGRWVKFGPELFTATNGTDHIDYRWNVRGTFQVRLLVPAADGHARSVSDVVTVRTR